LKRDQNKMYRRSGREGMFGLKRYRTDLLGILSSIYFRAKNRCGLCSFCIKFSLNLSCLFIRLMKYHKLNKLDKVYLSKCCLQCLNNSLKDKMKFTRSLARNLLNSS
jgi:hypothetical protein